MCSVFSGETSASDGGVVAQLTSGGGSAAPARFVPGEICAEYSNEPSFSSKRVDPRKGVLARSRLESNW